MNIKKWEVSSLNKDRAAQIAEKYEIPFFLAMLLDIRGFTGEAQIVDMLRGEPLLSDPYLLKDMDKGVRRIQQAIDGFEKIAIYGDYDADGVTATAIVFSYLETVGADVMYYIPQREGEGYGMNIPAVELLAQQGVKLIITVDNGIASVEEVAYAKTLGVDVVITDHHRPQEVLPQAVAVIDPYRADCDLAFRDFCGAGIALKLLIALEGGDQDSVLAEYSDLAALGTLADVVPLKGENRTIVKAGMAVIRNGGKPGIDALLEKSGCGSGKPLSAKTLTFTVVPRINATGRMGAPERAVRLLTCEYPEEAEQLAEEICGENQLRRKVEAEILDAALLQIQKNPQWKYDRVLVVNGDDWHHGVVGIVAARIVERFGKPCVLLSTSGSESRGSGRSVEGFSLFEAISSCKELLTRFGGHAMAAGVTLLPEQVNAFRIKINEYAKTACEEMPAQTILLDCKLNPASLTVEMPAAMELLEPFGSDNPQPLFGLFGMTVEGVQPVGGGGHLRITCSRNGKSLSCMRFGMRQEAFPHAIGDVVDLAVSLDTNVYKNQIQLTVSIRDMKYSAVDTAAAVHAYRLYETFCRREKMDAGEIAFLTPAREHLAAVYRYMLANAGKAISLFSVLIGLGTQEINLGKLLVCLDIFQERQLGSCTIEGEIVTFTPAETGGTKINIFESQIFEEMRVLAT